MMNIGIVGSGRIGSNIGAQLSKAGHEVVFSGSRSPARLEELVRSVPRARAATPAEAVATTDATVFAVPWTQIDDIVRQVGSFGGRVVIDTTNQFGPQGVEDLQGLSGLQTNAWRMPGARVAKAFNTYTSGFQRDVGDGGVNREIAMFFATLDESAVETVAATVAA